MIDGGFAFGGGRDESVENDRFAQELLWWTLYRAAWSSAFSVIAHSQGGLASLWLYTYHWSGLDGEHAPNGYLIQTLGTPWLGSPIFSLAKNRSAWLACDAPASLSEAGALANLRLVPAANQARVFYTNFWKGGRVCRTHEEFVDGAHCDWCLYLSEPFLLGSMNDGATVAGRLSSLKFGVGYEGNPEKGFCHAVWGLKFRKAPEYLDGRLLGLLNRQAARVSRGVAGLVDDDASGLVDDDAFIPSDDASSHRTRRRHTAPRVSTAERAEYTPGIYDT